MNKRMISFFVGAAVLIHGGFAYAHCEIPCGIYDDRARILMIAEHIATVEKSMKMIEELSREKAVNYNQLVRWIGNKEEHAKKIQDIAEQYFMTQRIEPVDEKNKEAYRKYIRQLTLLHELLVYAMKSKQTTDIVYVEKMRAALKQFEEAYFSKSLKSEKLQGQE